MFLEKKFQIHFSISLVDWIDCSKQADVIDQLLIRLNTRVVAIVCNVTVITKNIMNEINQAIFLFVVVFLGPADVF